MLKKEIEDVINNVLKDDVQGNILDLLTHIRKNDENGNYFININDENDESGWSVKNLGFIVITGSDDFPGPWTMWLDVDNIGEYSEFTVDEHIKEFAWSNVSPCGSCGGECSPGKSTKVFGKGFDNTCQANLMFINPDANTVNNMKKIIDIKKNEFQNH